MQKPVISYGQLLERLSALHRNLLRKFAQTEGLQFVHVEIIQYLYVCNRYSNTTQAISDYLGQTKSSISQSLAQLEQNAVLKRVQDKSDKRVFHLILLAKGFAIAERLNNELDFQRLDSIAIDSKLEKVLSELQTNNGMRGFGICASCKFNENPGKNEFVCGLTKEKLSTEDVKKICREHEAS